MLKEKKHNNLCKSRKAGNKIQYPFTVEPKLWWLEIKGIFLNLIIE